MSLQDVSQIFAPLRTDEHIRCPTSFLEVKP